MSVHRARITFFAFHIAPERALCRSEVSYIDRSFLTTGLKAFCQDLSTRARREVSSMSR